MISQVSRPAIVESYIVSFMLAFNGGFLDGYTYLVRGGVFANAQTGNIVLLGVNLANTSWTKVGHYLVPVLAFTAGIMLTDYLTFKYQRRSLIRWRQIILAVTLVALFIIAFLNQSFNEIVAIVISFLCAIQYQSFPRIKNQPYASTMCTGNLRSALVHLMIYLRMGTKKELRTCIDYLSVIGMFLFGAATSSFLTEYFAEKAILLVVGSLAIVIIFLELEGFQQEK